MYVSQYISSFDSNETFISVFSIPLIFFPYHIEEIFITILDRNRNILQNLIYDKFSGFTFGRSNISYP